MTKTYTIGDTVYELLAPTFGVLRHVAFFCRDAEAVETTKDLLAFLRDQTGRFLAGLLTPQGVHPADRDLELMARAIDWEADPDIATRVLDDFFDQPGASPENLLAAGRSVNTLAALILPSRLARQARAAGAAPSTPSSDTPPPSPEAARSSGATSSGPADTPTSEPASK
ncbi:hypothetical protein [Pseudodesulfovibrio pelocollis]|uniref:hypothetical protein n=1 Tax=Pseudodesulfovibrio pelocollis TaxID=3051432 RepID=UPI00255B09D3|nr:hypothetical protein [Pseudodesulfovibrio sp. SB368]